MGDNKPESQSLSLQVWETAQGARESSASCKGRSLEPGGQQYRQSPQSSRAEPPAADAKGDRHGAEQPSGVWGSAVSAVAWSLPQLRLERGGLHPSGPFDKCLGLPNGKWGISPGAHLWVVPLRCHSCSDPMCKYLRCVSLPDMSVLTTWADMSPCQMCLL